MKSMNTEIRVENLTRQQRHALIVEELGPVPAEFQKAIWTAERAHRQALDAAEKSDSSKSVEAVLAKTTLVTALQKKIDLVRARKAVAEKRVSQLLRHIGAESWQMEMAALLSGYVQGLDYLLKYLTEYLDTATAAANEAMAAQAESQADSWQLPK